MELHGTAKQNDHRGRCHASSSATMPKRPGGPGAEPGCEFDETVDGGLTQLTITTAIP